jgi:hypothetical protein
LASAIFSEVRSLGKATGPSLGLLSTIVISAMGLNPNLQMIEYFRLNIEYLRSASGGSILKRPIKK